MFPSKTGDVLFWIAVWSIVAVPAALLIWQIVAFSVWDDTIDSSGDIYHGDRQGRLIAHSEWEPIGIEGFRVEDEGYMSFGEHVQTGYIDLDRVPTLEWCVALDRAVKRGALPSGWRHKRRNTVLLGIGCCYGAKRCDRVKIDHFPGNLDTAKELVQAIKIAIQAANEEGPFLRPERIGRRGEGVLRAMVEEKS